MLHILKAVVVPQASLARTLVVLAVELSESVQLMIWYSKGPIFLQMAFLVSKLDSDRHLVVEPVVLSRLLRDACVVTLKFMYVEVMALRVAAEVDLVATLSSVSSVVFHLLLLLLLSLNTIGLDRIR